MKIILLTTIILTIAPVWGQGGNSKYSTLPCQTKSDDRAYDMFSNKHIVSKPFDRTLKKKWEKYLKEKSLCGRENAPVQSFIEASNEGSIKDICKHSGWRLKEDKTVAGNLCISSDKMTMYNVKSSITKKGCEVTEVKKATQFVVVACNKVQNNCRPVHFEKYQAKFKRGDQSCQS